VAAVKETAGKTPVIAGCGYGTAVAVELARSAEKSRRRWVAAVAAYLMVPSQEGLMAHIEAVCKATSIGIIVLQPRQRRAERRQSGELCERNPNRSASGWRPATSN